MIFEKLVISLSITRLPFIIHGAVETPAAFSFLTTPEAQLPGASTEAKLILRSYGGLLLITGILCNFFAFRETYDEATIGYGLSMAVYHLFPLYRALTRISQGIGVKGPQGGTLGGPVMHAVAHLICLVSLLVAVFAAWTETANSR